MSVDSRLSYHSLVDKYASAVFNLAMQMLGNREEAEEAAQDVFLQIHKSLSSFRGDSAVSTWIYRIAFNICQRRREKKSSLLKIFASFQTPAEDPPDDNPNPHEAIIRQEQSVRVAALLASLPVVESAALTLYYYEDKSYTEIGEILNIPPGTVATAMHRGRERLRLLMENDRYDL